MMMTEMGDHEKRRGYHDGFLLPSGCSSNKKLRIGENSPKAKKDKVGERVAALQQLVSPFGKTDTASVLNEATGYINFLHDQLQVLSAPYLGTGPNDTMQDKAAFIFCIEDRALFCPDCDEAIHVAGTLSGNHQRYVATGIRVALGSICNNSKKDRFEPPNQNFAVLDPKATTTQESTSAFLPSAWAVDEFLQIPDYEFSYKKESVVGFGELDWFANIGLFDEQIPKGNMTAAEVPELFPTQNTRNAEFYRTSKKPRIEISNEEEYFVVPDLG